MDSEEDPDLFTEFTYNSLGLRGARVSSRDRNWQRKSPTREFLERLLASVVFIVVLLAILLLMTANIH